MKMHLHCVHHFALTSMCSLTGPKWRHMATQHLVNIGLGNGLLPDGTKSLPDQLLTYHWSSPVVFNGGQFHWKCWRYQSLKYVAKLHVIFPPYFSGDKELKTTHPWGHQWQVPGHRFPYSGWLRRPRRHRGRHYQRLVRSHPGRGQGHCHGDAVYFIAYLTHNKITAKMTWVSILFLCVRHFWCYLYWNILEQV